MPTAEDDARFKYAVVDGTIVERRKYRATYCGIYQSRGSRPNHGKYRRRVQPSDVTYNLGEGVARPEGFSDEKIVSEHSSEWLAKWHDPVTHQDTHCRGISGEKDKFDFARLVKAKLPQIRCWSAKLIESSLPNEIQLGLAVYMIDKFMLRVGKVSDDSTGCCTLKIKHVDLGAQNKVRLHYVGKSAKQVDQTIEVEKSVYNALSSCLATKGTDKGKEDLLLDLLSVNKINDALKGKLTGFTSRCFRTARASMKMEEQLSSVQVGGDVTEVELKQVHHDAVEEKFPSLCLNEKKCSNCSSNNTWPSSSITIAAAAGDAEQLEVRMANVHLGPSQSAASTLSPSKNEPAVDTSYEYYVDPRITVAWCKRLGKDWKKIVTGKMQHVHAWADDTDADFVF